MHCVCAKAPHPPPNRGYLTLPLRLEMLGGRSRLTSSGNSTGGLRPLMVHPTRLFVTRACDFGRPVRPGRDPARYRCRCLLATPKSWQAAAAAPPTFRQWSQHLRRREGQQASQQLPLAYKQLPLTRSPSIASTRWTAGCMYDKHEQESSRSWGVRSSRGRTCVL